MNDSHELAFEARLCHSYTMVLGTLFNLSKPHVPHQYDGIYIFSFRVEVNIKGRNTYRFLSQYFINTICSLKWEPLGLFKKLYDILGLKKTGILCPYLGRLLLVLLKKQAGPQYLPERQGLSCCINMTGSPPDGFQRYHNFWHRF